MKIRKALILLILIIFPLGQLTRLPLNIPFVNIYLHDLLIFSLAISLLKEKGWERISKNRFWRAARPFLLVGLFSLLVNLFNWGWSKSFLGSLYLVRYLFFLSLLIGAADFPQKEKKNFLKSLVFVGWAVAVLGLLQYFFYPDLRSWDLFGWDPHWNRLVGAFFDPGFTALILVWTLILMIILFWKEFINFNGKFLFFWFLPVYLAFALTYSRSGYFAFLVAVALIAKVKKNWRFFLIAGSMLLLTLLFLPRRISVGTRLERGDTWQARIESWERAFKIWRKNPFWGAGFNNYRWAQEKEGFLEKDWKENHAGAGADNSFLFILATGGILGFLTFAYFLKKAFGCLGCLFSPLFFSWLAHGLVNNSLFYPWLMIWAWLILGLVGDL